MMEIIVDPLFPPENYTPVEEKRFELIYKEQSLFRLNPIRMTTNLSETKYNPSERRTSSSKQKPNTVDKNQHRSELYNIGKEDKPLKPVYSTPAETLKYLLDNYCFNDLDPFNLPSNLILSSPSLADEQCLESNLKKLKLITETRIARIVLEPKIFDLCCNILSQDKFNQRIKAAITLGFTNACKTFKAKLFVLKNLMPLISESIRTYRTNIDECYL